MLLKSKMFGPGPILLKLSYEDILENKHYYEQMIDPARNRFPLSIGDQTLADIAKAVKEISREIKSFNEIAADFYRANSPPPVETNLGIDEA